MQLVKEKAKKQGKGDRKSPSLPEKVTTNIPRCVRHILLCGRFKWYTECCMDHLYNQCNISGHFLDTVTMSLSPQNMEIHPSIPKTIKRKQFHHLTTGHISKNHENHYHPFLQPFGKPPGSKIIPSCTPSGAHCKARSTSLTAVETATLQSSNIPSLVTQQCATENHNVYSCFIWANNLQTGKFQRVPVIAAEKTPWWK